MSFTRGILPLVRNPQTVGQVAGGVLPERMGVVSALFHTTTTQLRKGSNDSSNGVYHPIIIAACYPGAEGTLLVQNLMRNLKPKTHVLSSALEQAVLRGNVATVGALVLPGVDIGNALKALDVVDLEPGTRALILGILNQHLWR